MGNCTVTINEFSVEGNKQVRNGTIALSASYIAGGDTVTAAQLGLSNIANLQVETTQVTGSTTTGWAMAPIFTYLATSAKVQAFGTGSGNLAALGEAANGDLHLVTTHFRASGY